MSYTCLHAHIHTPLSTHPGVCDLELTQNILGHVVLGHWVDDKVLVAGRALCRPVLVAFLLWTEGPALGSGGEEVGSGGGGKGTSRFQRIWERKATGGGKGLRLCSRGREGKAAIEEGHWCAHPAHLPKPGQHDNDGGVVLPQHAPEVLRALRQRPLRGYVGLLLSGADTRLDMLEVLMPPGSPHGCLVPWGPTQLTPPLRSPPRSSGPARPCCAPHRPGAGPATRGRGGQSRAC